MLGHCIQGLNKIIFEIHIMAKGFQKACQLSVVLHAIQVDDFALGDITLIVYGHVVHVTLSWQ